MTEIEVDVLPPPLEQLHERIHFVATGLTVTLARSDTRVMKYGDELTVTPELVRWTRNKYGRSWLSYSEDDQLRIWGRVWFRPGPWPEGQLRVEPGTDEFQAARRHAREVAKGLVDPEERRRRLAEIDEQFGPPPITSKTTWTNPNPPEAS